MAKMYSRGPVPSLAVRSPQTHAAVMRSMTSSGPTTLIDDGDISDIFCEFDSSVSHVMTKKMMMHTRATTPTKPMNIVKKSC
jgi:hypothetical protein